MTPLWDTDTLALWEPPEDLSVSEWAERDRLIVARDAAEPGPWHNERTPYLRGIMDAFGDEEHTEVVLVKAARVGGTEAARNALGYWIDQDPGPVLWVFPTENAVREQVRTEIVPLLYGVPCLERHLTGKPRDLKAGELHLDTMTVYTGWSGSAQSLGSKTIRRTVCDETDKFVAFSGRDADPISLARRRVTTYGTRGKCILLSTPTTSEGAIWKAWERCTDKRRFHVPCPHCGTYIRLEWSMVRWPDGAAGESKLSLADRVISQGLAWIECPVCRGRITENDRVVAVRRGEWCSDGYERGVHPRSPQVGFHISALYSSLGVTVHRLVYEYLRAEEAGYGAMMEFVTQALGLPFDGAHESVSADAVLRAAKRDDVIPRGVVPVWARALVMGVDTQKDHFCYEVRACDRNHSQLVDFGRLTSSDAVIAKVQQRYNFGHSGVACPITVCLIDAGGAVETNDGSTTEIVFRLAQRDSRILPCYGRGRVAAPFVTVKQHHEFGGFYRGRLVYHQPDFFKDVLVSMVLRVDEDDPPWRLCRGVTPEFIAHFSNARKVEDKRGHLRWGRRHPKAAIDFFDTSALCVVAQRLLELGSLVFRTSACVDVRGRHDVYVDGRGYWDG